MALSRKNYEAVAAIIDLARIQAAPGSVPDDWDRGYQSAVENIACQLSDYFRDDNSAFDAHQFITACFTNEAAR
jgi:hypothetical protein